MCIKKLAQKLCGHEDIINNLSADVSRLENEKETMMWHIPGVERPSPKGEIPQSAVTIDQQAVHIQVSDAHLGIFTDSNSMEPFDIDHMYIWTRNFDPNKLIEGDIVIYKVGERQVSHAIKEITTDEHGKLFRLVGWNNAGEIDPDLVRAEHIDSVMAGWINTYKED